MNGWLVWNMNGWIDFPFSWECHNPNWLSYFSEGWGQPPTSYIWISLMWDLAFGRIDRKEPYTMAWGKHGFCISSWDRKSWIWTNVDKDCRFRHVNPMNKVMPSIVTQCASSLRALGCSSAHRTHLALYKGVNFGKSPRISSNDFNLLEHGLTRI